ncbi:glycosyltransferase [Sporolactobacillus sp. THM7-4]|nr:glycosyltransferase [Sporolactobacillus sp. THM7-4]
MSYQVGYVSTYPPQKCGIATFTYHLRQNVLKAKHDSLTDPVVVIRDQPSNNSNSQLEWTIVKDRREDYINMAERLNNSDVSVVSLQHEFGIFGGQAGDMILEFVRRLRKPLVTTFHTVFDSRVEPYASIQEEIAKRSDQLVVMNHKAIDYLVKIFNVPRSKITFIPHGTPVPDLKGRLEFRKILGWSDRKIIMTFGFLSRNKGIEAILQALPEVVQKVPEVLYVIVGQTHPNVKREEGESYREYLKSIVREHGLQDHVMMIDEYMTEQDLVKYITACDLYVTPYPGMEQITSGTLAYAVGMGRPVLTTPYRYAQDLLKGNEELFVSYEDRATWSRKIAGLLGDPEKLKKYQMKMEKIGLQMSWPQVGKKYDRLFSRWASQSHVIAASSSEADDIVTSPR